MKRPVFVSQLAQLSSLGDCIDEFWKALLSGASGSSEFPQDFSAENMPFKKVHLIRAKGLKLPSLRENQFLTETEMLTRHLLREILPRLAERKLDAVCWGHGQLGIKFGDAISKRPDQVVTSGRFRAILRKLFAEYKIVTDETQWINHSQACVTGLTAMGEAFRRVQSGEWDRVLVVVQELRIRDWVLWPYYKMGMLAAHEMHPFSLGRNGFVKGEGGAAFIVESEPALVERGASPVCRISGYSLSSDGQKMTEACRDLRAGSRCLENALRESALDKNDVRYLNAYGSASLKNDAMETDLIKKTFGDRANEILISTSKPQFGHLNTAAGALELVVTALAVHHQVAPPTIQLDRPDPQCDLNYLAEGARKADIHHAMKIAFGFGWSNAAVVLSRC